MENRITASKEEIVSEKTKALFAALSKHRGTPILQRINAYVTQKKGKGMQEYIQNGASLEDKEALIDELTEIAEAEDWDKLPPAPGGQAMAPAAKPAAPAAKPMQPAAPAPAPAPEAEEDPEPEEEEAAEEAPVNVPEAATQLAALIAKLAQPAGGGSITEDRVREIVREELRSAFSSLL